MFWGRHDEMAQLARIDKLGKAALIVCMGRRRIGKSTLIKEFGKGFPAYIEVQGLAPRSGQSNQDQLDHFAKSLSRQIGLPEVSFKDWSDAFALLARQIEKKRTLLFLDEISWMGAHDSDFAGKLKIAWDSSFKEHPKLRLVVCGSVSSWIQKNILESTNFLGRISLELNIGELPLPDCHLFWNQKAKLVTDFEKCRILSVTGGVPRYLEEVDYSQSAESNIKELCFKKTGLLYSEFEKIFNDIFEKRAKNHKEIVRSLVAGGKNFSEICKELNVDPNGVISEHLKELELSGFIRKEFSWDLEKKSKTKNISKFRLTDNYLRFYLKYIEPNHNKMEKNLFKLTALEQLPQYEIIMGLQLENLVLNNIQIVLEKLNIPQQSVENAGPFLQTKTLRREGCQVDLLIQTRSTLYICEIKYRQKIDVEVIAQVKEKVRKLKFKKNLSIRPVLIYVGELPSAILDEDFFDRVINLGDLLNFQNSSAVRSQS